MSRFERARPSGPEVKRAAAQDRVPIVPVVTLEDHGPPLGAAIFEAAVAEMASLVAELRSLHFPARRDHHDS